MLRESNGPYFDHSLNGVQEVDLKEWRKLDFAVQDSKLSNE
jgi:hypothetical protein